jgi:hypothetical protein
MSGIVLVLQFVRVDKITKSVHAIEIQNFQLSFKTKIYADTLFYKQQTYSKRFQVPTAASMKMTVCWDVALCSLAEVP